MAWTFTQKVNAIKLYIQSLTKKKKIIALSALIAVVVIFVVGVGLVSGSSVKGRYDFYRISIDGEGIPINDAGYIEITGVDNDKISMFYIDLAGSTCRIKGKVYEVRKFDEYTKYRFEVSSQSGSALEDMEYFYFKYYPTRRENGLIVVDGLGDVELYFEKN